MIKSFLQMNIIKYSFLGFALLLFSVFPFLNVVNEESIRPPLPLVRVDTEIMRQLVEQYRQEKEKRLLESGESPRMSPATIRLSDRALLAVNHPWTNTPVINANTTTQEVNRRLFCDDAAMDMDVLYHNSPNTETAVAFFLDPLWNRIIFAKRSENWIKSYGEWNGPPRYEYQLASPRAMVVDISPNNALYVADTENGRILKLTYAVGYLGGEGSFSFTIPGVIHPVDISLPGEPTLNFWVADDWNGKLVEFTRGQQVLSTVENYTIGGQTYRLNRPRSVVREIGVMGQQRLAFVDGERNAFIVCNAYNNPPPGSTTITAMSSTEFSQSGSRLTSIGHDITQNWWVADPGLGKIHIFNLDGEYLASFNPPATVKMVSTSPCYWDEGILKKPLYVYTSEPWSNTNGMRAYLPGADVVGMQVEETSTHFRLSSVLTNMCYINVKLVRLSDGNVQTLYTGGSMATSRRDSIVKSSLQYGDYKFRVEVLPLFNSEYGADQVDWLIREVPFTYYPNLTAPTNVSAVGHPYHVQLAWSAVSGAQAYRVYRSTSSGGDFSRVADDTGTSHWNLVPNAPQTYYYYVRARLGNDEGPPSSTVSAEALRLQSTSPTATGSNSQRKLTAMSFTSGHFVPDRYYMIYESGGKLWRTQSEDAGAIWSAENMVSAASEIASSPSIAVWSECQDFRACNNTELYLVYRKQEGSDWRIVFSHLTPTGGPLSTTVISSPIPMSIDTKPIIARGSADPWGPLYALWQSTDGIMFNYAEKNQYTNTWDWFGEGLAPELGGCRNPSVSSPDLTVPTPTPFLTYDNGRDVFILTLPGYEFFEVVPASLSLRSYASQVSVDSRTGPQVHVVWEAYGWEVVEEPVADRLNTHKEGAGFFQRCVMYQQWNGSGWQAAHVFRSGHSNVSFYRPTVSNLSNGHVVWAWDDGSSTYKALYDGSSWAVTEVYNAMTQPNLAISGSFGPIGSTRFVATSTTGPPYRLALSSVNPNPPPVEEVYSREVVAAEVADVGRDAPGDSTTAHMSIELSPAKLKLSDGSVVPLSFVVVADSLPNFNEDNAWDHLASERVTLASAVDSIIIKGTVRTAAPGRIIGIGQRGLHLTFDVIDARTGRHLRTIGNTHTFWRDTLQSVRVRQPLRGLAGREVIIRPSLRGIARGRRDIVYTLVHVHTLIQDSSTRASVLAAVSPPAPEMQLPTEFALQQNYPNPFNPSTIIRYQLPEDTYVTVKVYDMLGREVATLVNEQKQAGYYQVNVDASSLASGIYLCRMTAGSYTATKKFVVLK